MRMIKIGILDEEQEYVKMLSAYLGRYGKGQWTTAAFTDREVLSRYLDKGELDIVAGTNREELKQLQRINNKLSYLWLSNRQDTGERELGFYEIYRYQSARIIGKMLEEMTAEINRVSGLGKSFIAIYSPVGRCGKTTLALEISKNNSYGRWLYIGMEDYSSFSPEEELENPAGTEDFFYHVKERQEEKVLRIIEGSQGIIGSGHSLFDTRQVDYEDMEWLLQVLQKWECTGAVFDMGTGILEDFNILSLFDRILVPCLKGEIAMAKRENFERMLMLHGCDSIREQLVFINMGNQDEVEEKVREIFRGNTE